MKGIIGFEHYRISCVIGVYAEERKREQEIYVDLKVEYDFSKCVQTDRVEDTLDYVKLADMCQGLAKKGHYQLLEKFASDVLKNVLNESGVSKAWIKVKKPGGLLQADYTTVELSLEK